MEKIHKEIIMMVLSVHDLAKLKMIYQFVRGIKSG